MWWNSLDRWHGLILHSFLIVCHQNLSLLKVECHSLNILYALSCLLQFYAPLSVCLCQGVRICTVREYMFVRTCEAVDVRRHERARERPFAHCHSVHVLCIHTPAFACPYPCMCAYPRVFISVQHKQTDRERERLRQRAGERERERRRETGAHRCRCSGCFCGNEARRS